jgi:hypothetical protein
MTSEKIIKERITDTSEATSWKGYLLQMFEVRRIHSFPA